MPVGTCAVASAFIGSTNRGAAAGRPDVRAVRLAFREGAKDAMAKMGETFPDAPLQLAPQSRKITRPFSARVFCDQLSLSPLFRLARFYSDSPATPPRDR